VALLAAGQSSTVTGTISGQIVMEGFLNIKMRPWLRRLVTRSIAIIPAAIVIMIQGNEGTYKLLILSQVILSLQLPFAVVPLIHFTSSGKKMGIFKNNLPVKFAAWIIASIIISLNVSLVIQVLTDSLAGTPSWLIGISLAVTLFIAGVLVYIILRPVLQPGLQWESVIESGGEKIAAKLRPMTVRHIGVALERTAGDADVISAALSLAGKFKAKLTLIHVVDDPGSMVLDGISESLHGRHDQAYLDEICREIETEDIPVEGLLRTGKPSDEIITSVEILGLDLLVLGSHGHRGLSDLVYGETVSSVRHSISIPVLIVRMRESSQERPEGKI
jgi:manganese transport protein